MKHSTRALAWCAGLAATGWACGVIQTRRAARRGPAGRHVGPKGARIHYVQAGAGPDVVLIHGTAMTLEDMLAAPFERLTRRYRVTAVDRPGHGFSDPNPGPADAQEQARILHRAMADLNLARPVIVGHSIGGAVALAWGRQWPSEVTAVVAAAPLAYPAWTAVHAVSMIHAAPVFGKFLAHTLLASWTP
jgi:pimeloyl-ACP methyl ester carboxylesterase